MLSLLLKLRRTWTPQNQTRGMELKDNGNSQFRA
jgi:hypothetical protein